MSRLLLLHLRHPRPLLLLALLVAFLPLGGCETCLLASCGDAHYLAATGQIVDQQTGQGIDGVTVRLIRQGGLAVANDSVTAVTAGDGFWRAEFGASDSGSITARVEVSPPGLPTYTLNAIPLPTRRSRGDASLNERWVPALYFPHQLELFREGTADTRIEGARVEFRRTAGTPIYGPGLAPGYVLLTTDRGGRAALFPSVGDNAVFATDDSPLIGTLTIRTLGRTTVIPNVSLTPSYIYQTPAQIFRYAMPGVPDPKSRS